MALVLAKQTVQTALKDPYVQQAAYQLASQGLEMTVNKIKGRNRKRKPKGKKNILQMINYQPPGVPKGYAPVAVNTRARTRRARITGMSGGVVVKHREYIGEVVGNTTFAAQSYQVQPGLSQSFPWLAGIANNFEKYRIRSLKLEYVNVSATSERGRITLAYDKDPLDEDPVGKVDLFAYEGAEEGSVWSPLSLTIPCKNEELFTRSGTVTGTDLKTYDFGRLVVGASNTSDTQTVGELFLSYEIELITPQPTKCPSLYRSFSGVTIGAPFTGTTVLNRGTFPAEISGETITFLTAGTFLVSVLFSAGTGLTGVTQGGTCSYATGNNAFNVDTAAKVMNVSEVRCSVPGLTYTIVATGTSHTTAYVWITMSGGLIM
jgi:hypothetical protein